MAGGKIRKHKVSQSKGGCGGIPFYKSKGQHILKNPLLLDSIVEKSGIKPTDVILEIGSGTGNLTRKLLEAGKTVIAVEVDPRMVLEVQRRFQGTPFSNRLKVIQGDVLKCDLPYFDICVANIPYQISSPLTFKLLSHRPVFRCAVIMFQREFAMRLVAQPGERLYSRLSVNVQLLSRVSHLLKVSRNNFRPPPKVDSSVVRIEPRKPLPPVNLKDWDGMLRICFGRKNKTLGALFRHKKVLALLEKNYRALQGVVNADPVDAEMDVSVLRNCFEELRMVQEGDDDDAEKEDEEDDLLMDCTDGLFKDRVLGVLNERDYGSQRSSKLRQEDFLYLLSLFNKAGIHFC